MSEVKVNKISPRTNCGTVQLGDSGDTITIPAGATITNNGTQTGFGRTGTVNWQTTIKTGDFTAVNGEGYFVDTTSGEIDVTLPASPSAGSIVSLKDYARTWGTNNCIVLRNSSNMDGNAANQTFSTSGLTLTFIYMDATKGWSLINDDETATLGAAYIVATGGNTTTTCGNFKIHTFTSPGTFCVSAVGNAGGSTTVSYLVVGGGGGGGANRGGGGGAGGFRESKAASDCYSASPLNATSGPTYNLPVSVQGYPITVGGGGAGDPAPTPNTTTGTSGSTSTFSTISSAGGGGGGSRDKTAGLNGGSGGGGGSSGPSPGGISGAGGSGNTPPVSPPQGSDGGGSVPGGGPLTPASGGGGATAVGANNPTSPSGPGTNGGDGATSSISGSPVARAGGGAGGTSEVQPVGSGGAGGGGDGGQDAPGSITAQDGTVNTGGGGGGAGGGNADDGGSGGSGIVIIRYRFQ